jgi:hypothetical protein
MDTYIAEIDMIKNVSSVCIILKTSGAALLVCLFSTSTTDLFTFIGIGLKMSSELFKVEKMASCPVYGRTIFLAFLRYYFFG